MKVVRYPAELPVKSSTLVLGAFESIHFGHEMLFTKAKELKLPVVVLVIDNPESLPKHAHDIYAPLQIRLQQLANLKIDYALVVNFSPQIRELTGAFFLKDLLALTRAKNIVVGEDFAMGFGRKFNAASIKESFASTFIVPNLKFSGSKISTSVLKELVMLGDVAMIRKLAPFPFTFEIAAPHDEMFAFPDKIVRPHSGAYVAHATIGTVQHVALVRIGMNDMQVKFASSKDENRGQAFVIELLQMLRPIVKADHDRISAGDEEQAAAFFKSAT